MSGGQAVTHLSKYGFTLVENGYEIIPIKRGKKYPTMPRWQSIVADKASVQEWLKNPQYSQGSVGILTKHTIAVDIDCLDKNLNKKLVKWLKENIGTCSVRVGKFPKCIIPFRVDEPFKKIKSAEWVCDKEDKHAVEILGSGQQFVAYGIHPGTQKEYRWQTGDLVNVPHKDLPLITREKALAFVAFFEKMAAEAGWEKSRDAVQIDDLENNLSFLKQKHDATEDDVREIISRLDPDINHDDWVHVGMALHHHFDGSNVGLEIWDDWSSKGSKYKDFETTNRYETFSTDAANPITMSTMVKLANEPFEKKTNEVENISRLEEMLRDWAFVQVEGSARVIREDLNKEAMVLYRLDDLKKEHMNCRILSGGERPKPLNLVDLWLEHTDRRTYSAGLTFAPDMEIQGRYNLWRGWSVPAVEGDVGPWLDFTTNVIAAGNEVHASYIVAWCAQMIQQPLDKVGVGLVLRGRKGTGKTKFGELLGGLVQAHHRIVSRAEQIVGNFNRHLEDTLLLQADEAYWAGAKSSEGALKDLLTNNRIQIERKGVDSYTAANYTRVLFTSNEDFVVPASLDERRFAVFDVSNCQAQKSEYFAALDAWYNDGGASALLHYLKNFDLSSFNLRMVPATQALEDQKISQLNTVNSWLLNCLLSGEIREHRVGGNVVEFNSEASKAEIYEIYCSSLRSKFEVPRRENQFWKELKIYDDMFGKETQRGPSGARVRCIEVKSLEGARFIFEAMSGLLPDWPSEVPTPVEDDDPFDPKNWSDDV